jgi:hypothetical protein
LNYIKKSEEVINGGRKVKEVNPDLFKFVNVESSALTLGCKVGSLHMTYLGLPLGAHFRRGLCGMVSLKEWKEG